MASNQSEEIAVEFPNLIRVYNDGRFERLRDTDFVPPSTDPQSGVVSRDLTIPNGSFPIPARLFLPSLPNPTRKLPLVVYFHGGAFLVGSPYAAKHHNFLIAIVSESSAVAVSLGYRKAPEHEATDAYADAHAALIWVGSHRKGNGPDEWLNSHADFDRVFLAGDSAGANIVHNMAIYAGYIGIPELDNILGIALIHPFFWGSKPIGSETEKAERKAVIDRLWPFVSQSGPNSDDPRVNPVAEEAPDLAGLGCRRVMVLVAEKDVLRDRGRLYYEAVSRSRWMGTAEISEMEEEDRCFHLMNLESEKAKSLIRDLADFFDRDSPSWI